MTAQEILKQAESYFKLDLEYLSLEYNGMPIKIRMNKNHGRNHGRNDDNMMHNLSLVSKCGNGGSNQDSYFENEISSVTYIQKQVWGISDWEDAENAIIEFLSDIDFAN